MATTGDGPAARGEILSFGCPEIDHLLARCGRLRSLIIWDDSGYAHLAFVEAVVAAAGRNGKIVALLSSLSMPQRRPDLDSDRAITGRLEVLPGESFLDWGQTAWQTPAELAWRLRQLHRTPDLIVLDGLTEIRRQTGRSVVRDTLDLKAVVGAPIIVTATRVTDEDQCRLERALRVPATECWRPTEWSEDGVPLDLHNHADALMIAKCVATSEPESVFIDVTVRCGTREIGSTLVQLKGMHIQIGAILP